MSIASIVTRGFKGGTRYIPTRGFLAAAPVSFAVVDTFLPRKRKEIDYEAIRREKRELREELIKAFRGQESEEIVEDSPIIITKSAGPDYSAIIKAQKLKRVMELRDQDDEETLLLLM